MTEFGVFNELREKNEYPIVFIGSGMSRRYLQDFPGWEELLKHFWDQFDTSQDFYGFLSSLKQNLKETVSDESEYDIEYLTNIHAGSEIERIFNERFNDGEMSVPDFDQEKAYKLGVSPFKVAIAKKFSSYKLKENMAKEFEYFKAFMNKTQIVITTNYDTLIEDSINENNAHGVKKYIGQRGFFEHTQGWAEVYKIHGCVSDPKSIVISKSDYDKFSKNSILISAKIIAMLINSPIIFLGYSLTDGNVRKILRDFSSSLTPAEMKAMSKKIIIVEREEGASIIKEQTYYDKDLGCEYTVIRTDNFQAIYEVLTEIDQGIHPAEVRKYQHVIKKLIVNRGKQGSLNTLLLSPEELEDIEKRIGDGKLVVALGDSTYIFQMPDLMGYLEDYFFNDESSIHTDIALRFVASQNNNARIPFLKHIKGVNIESLGIHPIELEKLKQRIQRYTSHEVCTRTISATYRIKASSLEEICEYGFKADKEYDVIAYNCLRLNIEDLGTYIQDKLMIYKEEGIRSLSTPFRRLLTVYDLLVNK